jgi:hypothetical protein
MGENEWVVGRSMGLTAHWWNSILRSQKCSVVALIDNPKAVLQAVPPASDHYHSIFAEAGTHPI